MKILVKRTHLEPQMHLLGINTRSLGLNLGFRRQILREEAKSPLSCTQALQCELPTVPGLCGVRVGLAGQRLLLKEKRLSTASTRLVL